MMSGSCRKNARRAEEKVKPNLSLDLHLVHPLELVLDRVLDRADVDLGLIELVEAGIERGRLAATGRTGHQRQAVRRVDRLDQVLRLPLVQAQAGQVERDGRLVQDSHDHLFAVDRGDRVDAEVDPLVAGPQGDGAVLGDCASRRCPSSPGPSSARRS